MTVRQQIEALIHAGARDCEIEQQLKCDRAYIYRVRKATGIANKNAYAQRMPKLIELVAQGLSDEQIAPHFGISPESVRKMRNAGNVRRIRLHEKHHEVVALLRQKNKQIYVAALFGLSEWVVMNIWRKQQLIDKKAGTKTASAGCNNQQVDIMTVTDLQSDRSSDISTSI
ncbi:hypothetical protein [Flavobacterium sp.]|jgi:hypothetical protein|uniref:hypothetical protein n=1 Tax=Flavobacterium sp. TaxID=239 RepID=UPI0037BF45F2